MPRIGIGRDDYLSNDAYVRARLVLQGLGPGREPSQNPSQTVQGRPQKTPIQSESVQLLEQLLAAFVQLVAGALEAGYVTLHSEDIGGGFASVGPVDRRVADGGIALGVIVEVVVEYQLLTGETYGLIEGIDLIADYEELLLDPSHQYREGDSNPHGLAPNGF